MERLLTTTEEKLLRLHHHDFGGLDIETTATKMGWTSREIKNALSEIKKKTPQMFPILTPLHRAILAIYDQRELQLIGGRYQYIRLRRKAIAKGLGIKFSTLVRGVAFLRRHGFLKNLTMEQFNPALHDGCAKERF